MRKEEFAEIVGDISDRHIVDARAERKTKKPIWLKWGAMAACLCLVVGIAIPTIQQNFTQTQEPDTIELVEVSEWSPERVERKLIGEDRRNILHSWGEPDSIISDTSDKYYLAENSSEYIILHYDEDGYIYDFEFGSDTEELNDTYAVNGEGECLELPDIEPTE